jgi:uncharacterized repeat protein (TIGR01451 family)
MLEHSTLSATARRSRVLAVSFGASLMLLASVLGAVLLTDVSANATSFNLTSTAPVTNWGDITKWNGGTGSAYPGQSPGDVVTVTLGGGATLNINVNVPNPVQLNISTAMPITVPSGGSLILEASSSVTSNDTVTINGGTFGVNSAVTLSSWQGPITMNSGTLSLGSGATLQMAAGSTVTVNGGTISGGGTLKIPSGHTASFTGSGGAMTLDNVIFDNSGTTTYSSSANALSVNNGAQIANESGATFTYSSGQPINTDNVASPKINNLGTINISAGNSPTINAVTNNDGTIALLDTSQSQTLTLAGGGTHTGTFSLNNPSTIAFNGAHNFNSGFAWSTTGNSTFALLGGTSTVNTGFSTPNFKQTGGTLAGSGNVTVSNTFDWQGGTQTGLGTTVVNGPGSITGTSLSTLDSGRTLSIAGGSFVYNPGAGGGLAFTNGSTLTMSGGTLDLQGDTAITADAASAINVSGGTVKKTAGSRTLVGAALSLNGSSAIQPSAGTTIAFGNGGSIGGTSVTVDNSFGGATIEFAGGTTTLNGGTTITSGNFLVSGGTLQLNNANTLSTLTESSGSITGTATLTTNTLNWTGGSMNGTGAVTVVNTSNINGGATTLTGWTLTGGVTVHYAPTAALAVNSAAHVINNGTWNLENGTSINSDLVGSPMFTNSGVLSKTIAGTTLFGVPFSSTGTFTLNNGADIELTGSGILNGSLVQFTNAADILGITTSAVNIAATSAVTGPGTIRVGSGGTLQVNATESIPNLELDSGSGLAGSSTLTVTGKLAWNGGTMSGGGTTVLQAGATGDFTTPAASLALSNRTFNNSGTINYNPAFPLAFQGSAQFTNLASGILNITGAGGTSTTGVSNSFNNQGTINRSGSPTFFTFDLPVTNSGTVNVTGASDFIAFSGGGSMTGGTMQGTVSSAGIEFAGGTFNVSGGGFGTAGGVKVNGGTLNINTTATAPAGFALVSGTLGGTGSLSLPSGGSGTISGGTILNTTLTALGGSTLTFDTTSSGNTVDGSTININSGATANWNGANQLFLANGAAINDAGTWNWTGGGNVATSGTTPAITVSGALNKTTSTATTGVAANLQNAGGTISAQAGALQLNYNGTSNHSGTFDTSSGAEIDFGGTGGSSTFTNVTNTGTGLLKFLGGTHSFTTGTTLNNLELDQATLAGGAILTYTGTFDWKGGTVNCFVNNSGGTLNLLGTLGNMTLGADLSAGTVNFTSANALNINSGVTFNSSGTFTLAGNGNIGGATGTLHSIGTITRTTAGSNTISAFLSSSGPLNLGAGSLTLTGGSNIAGALTSASGTTLALTAGSHNLLLSSSLGAGFAGTLQIAGATVTDVGTFAPAGTLAISSGSFAWNGSTTATMGQLAMSGGTLSGSGAIQLDSTTNNWTGGTITGTPSFDTFTVNGNLNIAPAGTTILDGRTLTNTFHVTLAAGATFPLELDNGAAIVNTSGSTFDMQNDAGIITNAGSAAFSNAGLLTKSAGSGTQPFSPALTTTQTLNLFSGTLQLLSSFTQSAGTTTLNGGTLSTSAATLNFSGGTLAGAGSINASLTNSGATINPGTNAAAGTLTINGAFNQTAGTLIADLFGNGNNDQLSVSGTANVAGNVNVQLQGGYTPAGGDSYTLINSSALTDTATKNLPAFGTGGSFTATDTPTMLTLQAVVATADLALTASAPATTVHNGSWTVTFNVTNNGASTATNVSIPITVTGGTIVTAGTPVFLNCNITSPTTATCTAASMTNGQSGNIALTITPATAGSVGASGTVSATEGDPNSGNNSASASATASPSADLSLVITDVADPVNAGGMVQYHYAVTNNGPDTASCTVTGSIAGGTANAGICNPGGGNNLNCGVITLASGGSQTLSVTVNAGGSGPVTATGTVAVTGGVVDPNAANDSSSQSTAITPQADLKITKSAPASVFAGSNINYTITVTNLGPSDATSVQVTDPAPAGLTFVGNSGACSGAFPCALGTLPSGQSATITSTWSTSPSATGSVSNTAAVSTTTGDPVATNNSATATTSITPSADVAALISGPATANPGSSVTVTIQVKNFGPSDAHGVSVSASASPSLAFVSNSGGCTTAFPCALGTLTPGQMVTITTTYNVSDGGATSTVTATASTTTPDPNSANDSASHTISTGCPSSAPSGLVPFNGATGVATGGTFVWQDVGAEKYNVYLGHAGSGCSALYATVVMGAARVTQLNYSGLDAGTQYEWSVEAVTTGCPARKSACVTFTTATSCNAAAPVPQSPVSGTVSSPVTFTWTASSGATLYTVLNAADDLPLGTSTTTTLANVAVPDGPLTWYVVADVSGCGALRSANAAVNICSLPQAPLASAVAEATMGQSYDITWQQVSGASGYELDQATNAAFTDVVTQQVPPPPIPPSSFSQPLPPVRVTISTPNVTQPSPFFYRVRARSACAGVLSANSPVIRVVVIPPPPKGQKNGSVNVPVGSKDVVVQQVFVPGVGDGAVHTFTATVDKPWLTVSPSSGILPNDGITLDVSADPASLVNGTETGTVIVTISSGASASSVATNGATVVSVPVSVNLVTPVTPSTKDLPPPNTLIIPSVGHLDGLNSHWQSDIRLANTGASKQLYELKFTPADPSAGGVKSTRIDVDGGATTALDDIVRNWYGIGALGDSANGVLEIRPLLSESSTGAQPNDSAPSVSRVTVASSRTYNVSSNGTLGQFIPAIPFSAFIGKSAQSAVTSVLSLQQIAQSDQYRTNVGIVEGSGQPATVLLTVFDNLGRKMIEVPLSLKGGEQRQLNGFLAANGISNLADARIEVKVSSGDGRVTAYASVVDNQSQDPLLVSGVPAGATATNWVLPGVADINTGIANWRTDARIFNGGTSPQTATLTFFPQGGAPVSHDVVINAREVKTLDSIVAGTFGLSNAGGALHVTTATASPLVVTGRTYNATSTGTYGQFIPAVTDADAIGNGDRPLNILQVEDSVRYRTNIGLAEVSGKPVGVDVFVNVPDTKVTPVVHVDLGANDFQQFNPFRALGLENVYNARVSVRVTSGSGRVTAYGSVVDMQTNDPTYVPAQ